ncbi:MAG TPA: hypothetical protein VJB57_05445, partial [Dehalococcoidia bacterium]|nr:hypothetical protein [Dehalococcoidia bacterium]
MFNSGVLDVAIGVVLVYLLLSLLCSSVTEMIAGKLKLRSRDLEQGIKELLSLTVTPQVSEPGGEGAAGAGNGTAPSERLITLEGLTGHPLIRGLSSSDGPKVTWPPLLFWVPIVGSLGKRLAWLFFPGVQGTANLPSYIPSRTFAGAVLDLLNSPDALTKIRTKIAGLAASESKDYLEALFATPNLESVRLYVVGLTPSVLPDEVRERLDEAIGRGLGSVQKEVSSLEEGEIRRKLEALLSKDGIESILATIDKLPEGELKRDVNTFIDQLDDSLKSLRALARGVANDATRVRREVEVWFDDGMDRVSGWYKRRAQAMILVIALPVIVALNADTFTMANTLLQNSTLRERLANAGAQFPGPAQTQGTPEEVFSEIRDLNVLGWKPASGPDAEDTAGRSGAQPPDGS